MGLEGLLAVIIDKDLDLTASIAKSLEQTGLTCQTITDYSNPSEIIKILEDKAPRIIFIDVDEGDEGRSLKLLVDIKSNSRYGEVPVIITSKVKHKKLETKVIEAGALKYYVKPIPQIELDLVLRMTEKIVNKIKLEKYYSSNDKKVEIEMEFDGTLSEFSPLGFTLTSPVRFEHKSILDLSSKLFDELSISKSVKRAVRDIGVGSGGYRIGVEFVGLNSQAVELVGKYRKK